MPNPFLNDYPISLFSGVLSGRPKLICIDKGPYDSQTQIRSNVFINK